MMTEREVEPIMDKLKEVERMVLDILVDDGRRDCWRSADECRRQIWKAMDHAGDLAR